jgi:AraC-like DNA-binding protein
MDAARHPTTEWVTRRPAPPLRGLVENYVGYRITGVEPGFHRGLPSRHLTVIVSIDDTIDVIAQTHASQAPDRYSFVIGGLQARPALIAYGHKQEGVAIELTPLGCRGLLGLPASALWDLSVEAADVMGSAAVELWERLQVASAWDDRFAACDTVLLGAVRDRPPVAPSVSEAWRLLVASGGTVPVADVAARVGWSRRHLAGRFRAEFGLSPKLAARVVRFERARLILQRRDRPSIAEVAAVCGYYDQPHLTRDFVELAGCPPGQLLDEDLPSVQDGEAPTGAASEHD